MVGYIKWFCFFLEGALCIMVLGCSNSAQQLEACEKIWVSHIEQKEATVASAIKNIELNSEVVEALNAVSEVKDSIKQSSRNLADMEVVAMLLFIDQTASGSLYDKLEGLEFSKSDFAKLKYGKFDDRWGYNSFNNRTAAEALVLLTDLQLDIANYYMAN